MTLHTGHNPISSNNFRTARDWHLHHVYNDSDFNDDIDALKALLKAGAADQEIQSLKEQVASSFAITVGDIDLFMLGGIIPLAHQERTATMSVDLNTGEFVLRFQPNTTRAELLETWNEFEKFRNSTSSPAASKRKPPESPSLIYAIFRARQRNNTFREIYALYTSGQLPGYTGSREQFNSEDSLERYYNKFKPQ